MAILLQLPKGVEGWMEYIVPIVIIGGAVLGPVAKWLIAKTSPERSDEPEEIGTDRREAQPSKPRQRVPQARPTARPMPFGGEQPEAPARPRVMPLPPQTEARPVVIQQPSRPVIPPPPRVEPRRPSDRPTRARPAPPPVQLPPAQVAREQRRVSGKPKQRRSRQTEQSPRVATAKRKKQTSGRREHGLSTLHLQPDAEPSTEQPIGEFDEVRHPTRSSLRKAILMNEILGPPLALRPPDEG